MKIKQLVLIVTLFMGASCTHEPVAVADMEKVCFTEDILPLFQNNCTSSGCHDASSSRAGYNFEDYIHIMEAITPNDAQGSKAYQAITNSWNIMPPSNPISSANRNKILIWIEQGAENTTCNDTILTIN